MLKIKVSASLTAALVVSALSSQSCFCGPCDFSTLSEEDRKGIEWQRDFRGSSEAYDRKDYAEAERLGNAAVKIAEGFKPDDHRLYTTLHNLVFVYRDQKKWDDAERLLMRSLEISKDNPTNTAEVYRGLGTLYLCRGDSVKSDKMMAAALVAAETGAGKALPTNYVDAERLGNLYLHAKRYAEAEPLLLQALKLQEEQCGPDHLIVAVSLANLAQLYVAEGKLTEAEALYKRGIVICEKQGPAGYSALGLTLNEYAQLLEKMKRNDEAKLMFERSERLMQEAPR